MGVLADWQIERDIKIEPFAPQQKREGIISYGLTSYGYDVRCGYVFKVFSPINASVIDPKDFNPNALVTVDITNKCKHDWKPNVSTGGFSCGWRGCNCECTDPSKFDAPCRAQGNHILIPPNSFALAESYETFTIPRDVLCIVLGKSTYARCGLVVNVTPGEPEWTGKWTIELSNTTPLPIKVYAGEGIMQCIFLRSDGSRSLLEAAVKELIEDQSTGRPKLKDDPTKVDFELWSWMQWKAAERADHALADGNRTCRTSYMDKKGKYNQQTGLTLPKVDGGK